LEAAEELLQDIDDLRLALAQVNNAEALVFRADLDHAAEQIEVHLRRARLPKINLPSAEDGEGVVEFPLTPASAADPSTLSAPNEDFEEMSDAASEEPEVGYRIETPVSSLPVITTADAEESERNPFLDVTKEDLSIQSFGNSGGVSIDDFDDSHLEEDNVVIASTPDAEKYFSRHSQHREDAIVDVPQLEGADQSSALYVKPVLEDGASSMEVTAAGETASDLTVLPLSSFECLYDGANVDVVAAAGVVPGDQEMQIGDRHRGHYDRAGDPGSFENIYRTDASVVSSLPATSAPSEARWSAPAEAPVLAEEAFDERMGELSQRIDAHWTEIEDMIAKAKADEEGEGG